MYNITRSSEYKKDIKKLRRLRENLDLLEQVIAELSNKDFMHAYHNHKLNPKKDNIWECHIGSPTSDLVLVYRYEDNTLLLLLLRTGSHSELFESSMKFILVETLNQLPKEIIDLNNKMNKAEYDAKDFEHYRTIPIDEWDLNNAGCCWDFVSYEADQFDKMKYDYETYFVQIDNNNDCPTHTFLIFKYNNKWYWFESSWLKYQGIKEFDTKEDAINHVCNLLFDEYDKDNEFDHYIFKYDTELVKDGNMNSLEYMNKIYDGGQEISSQEITK